MEDAWCIAEEFLITRISIFKWYDWLTQIDFGRKERVELVTKIRIVFTADSHLGER